MFLNERADIYLENISDGIKNVTFLKWCAVEIDSFWWACFWFLLLLLSLLFIIFSIITSTCSFFQMCSAPKLHDDRVRKIQNEIKKWNDDGRQKKLCTGRSGWQTVSLRVG